MRDGQKHQLATLTPVAASVDRVTEVALDHGDDRFALPALSIIGALGMFEQSLHQASVLAGRPAG